MPLDSAICCRYTRTRTPRITESKLFALSLIFRLFYKIIPAIYSRALKLVCRTGRPISRAFWQAAASHYILCIIIMTIMRVYDREARAAATGMFHARSPAGTFRTPIWDWRMCCVRMCALSSFAGISHVCNFFSRYINSAKTNQVLLPYYI